MKDYSSYKQLKKLCKKRDEDDNCKMLVARYEVTRIKTKECNGKSCPVWRKQIKKNKREKKDE